MGALFDTLLLLLPAAHSLRHACIVGGGVAGLRCAQILSQHGLQVTLLERADGVGGRVRTDACEGFLLDRGFRVFIAAYPESRLCLDYERLQLREFVPGAYVQLGDGATARHLVADPSRRPDMLLDTMRFPIGSLVDKARLVLKAGLVRAAAPEGHP